MAMDPITAGIDLASTLVQRFFPDKTAQEQQQLAATLTVIQGQMAIDQAEAQSSDPLQHWRGGLGWVCTMGYAWDFVLRPLIGAGAALLNHPIALPELDIGSLSALTFGMLGLGGLHVTERIKGTK